MTSKGKYLGPFSDSCFWQLVFWMHVHSKTNAEESTHFDLAQGTALSQCWLEKLAETSWTSFALDWDKLRASLDCIPALCNRTALSLVSVMRNHIPPSLPCLSSSLLCKEYKHHSLQFHPRSSQGSVSSRVNARFIQVAEAQRLSSRTHQKRISLIRSKLSFYLVVNFQCKKF